MRRGLAIAVIMPLSGFGASIGLPIRDAVESAIREFTDANSDCRLEVKAFDTRSADSGSLAAANAIAADGSVIGVIGPLFSQEVSLIGDLLSESGVPFASPSATLPTIADVANGFFRGLPNEVQLAQAGGNYLTKRLGLDRICIIAQDYPETQLAAETVRTAIGQKAVGCSLSIGLGLRGDYRHEIELVAEAKAQAVYFAGYAPHAAIFVRDLHAGDPDILFMGWEGVFDGPDFVKVAADSGRGTLAVGSFLPTAKHLQAPAATSEVDGNSRFATEAYELATIMAHGVGTGAAMDRASMRSFLEDYSGNGSIRRYGWADSGELSTPELILYEVG